MVRSVDLERYRERTWSSASSTNWSIRAGSRRATTSSLKLPGRRRPRCNQNPHQALWVQDL